MPKPTLLSKITIAPTMDDIYQEQSERLSSDYWEKMYEMLYNNMYNDMPDEEFEYSIHEVGENFDDAKFDINYDHDMDKQAIDYFTDQQMIALEKFMDYTLPKHQIIIRGD